MIGHHWTNEAKVAIFDESWRQHEKNRGYMMKAIYLFGVLIVHRFVYYEVLYKDHYKAKRAEKVEEKN
jgi:uncharacterized protein YktB (UPF0637 family)